MKNLLALLLVLCMLPVCGLAADEPWRADRSNMPISDEKIELDVFTVVTADVEDMETNEMTLMMEELTNVHVNWLAASSSDWKQQYNLSLASGDYADIYMTWINTGDVMNYGIEEGVFIPLEDLIEEHAPNMRKILETWPEIREYITAPDGHIYTWYRDDGAQNSQVPVCKLWVFQPWLKQYEEATGKGEPQTLDEFRAMLEYFRDNDMNGNGDATDEIPLLGTYAYAADGSDPMYWIMNCFTYFPRSQFYVQDNEVKFAPMGEGFREGLRYVRQLVVDGLLDEVTYTHDLNQYRAVVNVTEAKDMKVGVAAAPYYMRFVTQAIYANAAEDFYIIEPVTGPTGLRQTPSHTSAGGLNWAITSACEDPVAAIKWMDYLCSREMTIYGNYGDEGVDFVYTGDYDEVNGPVIKKINSSLIPEGKTTQNRRWCGWMSRIMRQNEYSYATELNEEGSIVYNELEACKAYNQYAINDGVPAIIWPIDEEVTLEANELSTQLVNYAKNAWTQFIVGTMDINDDAQWAAYEQGLLDYDLERTLEVMAEYYGLK